MRSKVIEALPTKGNNSVVVVVTTSTGRGWEMRLAGSGRAGDPTGPAAALSLSRGVSECLWASRLASADTDVTWGSASGFLLRASPIHVTSGSGVIGETLGGQGEKVRTDGYVSLCSASPTTAIGTSGSKLRSMELRHSHPLDTDTLAIRLCELSIIISSFRVTLLFWASMKWASMKRASYGLHAIQTISDISICTAIRRAATSLNSLARFYPMSVVPWLCQRDI